MTTMKILRASNLRKNIKNAYTHLILGGNITEPPIENQNYMRLIICVFYTSNYFLYMQYFLYNEYSSNLKSRLEYVC